MQIKTICGIVTCIFILIGSLRFLKEAKSMDMILGKCKLSNSFPYFQLYNYVFDAQFQCIPTIYMYVFSIN